MEILTSFLLYVIRLGISYSTLMSFSQYSNFQMFSNDILRARIDTKSVTEKTVTNLNLNFKFLFNVKFGSWAFRNCAYFVMEPVLGSYSTVMECIIYRVNNLTEI